jgi:hypothetical protein
MISIEGRVLSRGSFGCELAMIGDQVRGKGLCAELAEHGCDLAAMVGAVICDVLEHGRKDAGHRCAVEKSEIDRF